jgi:PqqD family protein of HPr-rel-A system
MNEAHRRWVAPLPEELVWMEDGPQAVVFDRRSQQTHVLNPTATTALRLLLDGPLDAAELGRRMAGPGAAASDGSGAELASEILRTFDELGLIEPAGL